MTSTFANLNSTDKIVCMLSIPYAAARYAHELIFTYLLPVARATDNWIGVAMVYMGLAPSARVTLRKGGSMTVNSSNIRALVMEIKGRNIVGRDVGGDGWKAKLEYGSVDARGKTVVDVGAYNGDSAIFFAKRMGARNVLAFEPVRDQYLMALRNVRSMRLGKRIRLFDKAVSPANSGRESRSFSLSLADGGRRVPLDRLVARYGLRDAVLKIDCEGCEYGLVQSMTPRLARAFGTVVIRYHKGYLGLARKLRGLGYAVEYTRPVFRFASAYRVLVAFGVLYARKSES